MLTTLVASCCVLASATVEPTPAEMAEAMKPPKEMAVLQSMVGKFKANMGYFWGINESKGTSSMSNQMILNGRYLQCMVDYTETTMGTQSGLLLMTYDAKAKQFRGDWRDSTTGTVLQMSGPGDKNGFTATSEFAEDPMMGGRMQVVAKYEFKPKGVIHFRLDMRAEADQSKWMKLMEGDYTRTK
ncbi:MAG: DUF1579 family protein [Chthonomonas sp.]|nr:DUF1579 family protein [Chthonomonas sp.]